MREKASAGSSDGPEFRKRRSKARKVRQTDRAGQPGEHKVGQTAADPREESKDEKKESQPYGRPGFFFISKRGIREGRIFSRRVRESQLRAKDDLSRSLQLILAVRFSESSRNRFRNRRRAGRSDIGQTLSLPPPRGVPSVSERADRVFPFAV